MNPKGNIHQFENILKSTSSFLEGKEGNRAAMALITARGSITNN